jgi:hypothetical protein
MRAFLIIIFLSVSTLAFGQLDSTTFQFLNSIIKRSTDSSTIFYTDKVDSGMYSYLMNKSVVKRTIKDINKRNKNKLYLTTAEIKYLKQNLDCNNSQQWPENLFTNSKRIPHDSTYSFLIKDRNRDLYLLSKPIFIRGNTIALFYVAHLCCGDIYGSVDLSFYRKEANKWQKWIRVGGGAF